MAASKQPQRSNLTSDLKPTTLVTLVSMCILPLTDILVTSEANPVVSNLRLPISYDYKVFSYGVCASALIITHPATNPQMY